jgi:hypothetical protein
MIDKVPAPSFSAVESALSEIASDHNLPLTLEVAAIFAEIVRDATHCDPETRIDAELLVRTCLLSFFAGFRAAHAQRDAEALEKLIATQ